MNRREFIRDAGAVGDGSGPLDVSVRACHENKAREDGGLHASCLHLSSEKTLVLGGHSNKGIGVLAYNMACVERSIRLFERKMRVCHGFHSIERS